MVTDNRTQIEAPDGIEFWYDHDAESVNADAPDGMVFVASTTHAMTTDLTDESGRFYIGGTFAKAKVAVIQAFREDFADGLKPCDDPDCEYCKH